MTRTPPDLLREKLHTLIRFPCEGKAAQIAHVKNKNIGSALAARMHELTGVKKVCKWITCAAYKECDLLCWGGHNPERDEACDMLVAMTPDIAAGRGPFNDKDRIFLEDLQERLEQSEHFTPTQRQQGYLRLLYERWDSKR